MSKVDPAYDRTFRLLGGLAAFYPNQTIPDPTVDAYCKRLQGVPGDVLNAAFERCVETCKWFPTLAEILEHVTEVQALATGGDQLTAHEAWAEFKRGLGRSGIGMTQPHFEHEVVERIARMLGWQAFALSEPSDEPSWRAQFINAFTALMAREEAGARMLPSTREAIDRIQPHPDAPRLSDARPGNGSMKSLAEVLRAKP